MLGIRIVPYLSMSVKLTHFLQNLSIDSITGRFIVKVPFHEDCSELGASNDKIFYAFIL